MWALLGPTRSSVAVLSLVSLTAIYIDLSVHTDVAVHNDICLTESMTAFLGTQPRAEPSGTRFDGSVHDGDPSIEKMPTSKKIATISVQFVSSGALLKRKNYVSSTVWIWKLALDHDVGWAEKNDTRRSS